ncbi:MAG: hypothetical protein FWD10_06100, partial [Candidatus Bathyarchaeota archaeon]|nr:hypothetical protein [Candidatus Termitimicrobium sp.]MCL2432115.1 hypothetical protein [Candidatus Termitimicrobium sp.]
MAIKSTASLQGSRYRILLVVSLILVVVGLVSLLAYSFLAADAGSIRVKTASELRDAVNNAEVGVHIDIALTMDISVGSALSIPPGTNITLTSATGGMFKLIGLDGQNVITVNDDAVLSLDGVIITHNEGDRGNGVVVNGGGTFIMLDGEISGHNNVNARGWGGGVWINVSGVFELAGGVISGNIATNGAGVYNEGAFKMSGGKITNNTATHWNGYQNDGNGGGVYEGPAGSFTITNGEISNNTATYGGGVY